VTGPEFGHFTGAKQAEKVAIAHKQLKIASCTLDIVAKDSCRACRLGLWGELAL
jgi:hypothetical protein